MSKHRDKDFEKQLLRAQELSCNVIFRGTKTNGGKYLIQAPNGELYIAHLGKTAIHPIRRFLNRIECAA